MRPLSEIEQEIMYSAEKGTLNESRLATLLWEACNSFPRNTRSTLDKIVELIINAEDPEEVWLVLSAQRGPDSEDVDLKERVTCPIRLAFFGSYYNQIEHKLGLHRPRYLSDSISIHREDGEEDGHFLSHARKAARILKLGIRNFGED